MFTNLKKCVRTVMPYLVLQKLLLSGNVLILTTLFFIPLAHSENMFDQKTFRPLVSDNKAIRKGDMVTLYIVENAKAESRASTSADKTLTISPVAEDNINQYRVGAGVNSASEGDARTSRGGFITAQLTVTVVDINAFGHLAVKGEQKITINGEEQRIRVSGSLRPEDIDSNNTTLSSKLANAEIEFTGEGIVGDQQKHSIIYRLLNWMGIL